MVGVLQLWLLLQAPVAREGPSIGLTDLRRFLSDPRWREREVLRRLLPGDAGILGYDRGPGWAFLAAAVTGAPAAGAREMKRFLIATGREVVGFTLISELPGCGPPRDGDQEEGILRTGVLARRRDGEAMSLSVYAAGPVPDAAPVDSIDFAGVRLGRRVLLFWAEHRLARSTASFYIPGKEPLQFVVAGLNAGTWEIWRDGWLEDNMALVSAGSGVLEFEGPAGS